MRYPTNPTASASFGDDIVLVVLLALIITIEIKWVQYLFESFAGIIA